MNEAADLDTIDCEQAAAILLPYFDAVRDTFAEFEPEPGLLLAKVSRTKYLVDESFHDTERHFAACREDGKLIYLAPEIVNLPTETLVAIISHEFGHASDFLYPGHWHTPTEGPGSATWLGSPDSKTVRGWRTQWESRDADQIEWAADAIAKRVTGRPIGYCGPCMIQCFSGRPRPRGLR